MPGADPVFGAGGVRQLTARAVPQPVERPYRMSRRARLAITVTVLVAAAVVLSTGLVRGAATGGTVAVTVQTGDSLWAIAARIAPDADRWSVIDQISELNGLTSSELVAGQTLLVPAP